MPSSSGLTGKKHASRQDKMQRKKASTLSDLASFNRGDKSLIPSGKLLFILTSIPFFFEIRHHGITIFYAVEVSTVDHRHRFHADLLKNISKAGA